MTYERGNRIRSTNAISIAPLPVMKVGWCINKCRTRQGVKKSASHSIMVMGYPFGMYCKVCTNEIWKTWNEIIGGAGGEGTVVHRSKKAA